LVRQFENESNTTPLLDDDHMSDMHQPILNERSGLLDNAEEYTRYDPSDQFDQMGAYSDYQSMGSMDQPNSQLTSDLPPTSFSQDAFEQVPQTSFSQDGFEQDDFENDNYDE
jgi:hypothetical protein